MLRDPLSWLSDELSKWESAGLRRRLAVRDCPQSGARVEMAGHEWINFGSNDYLGLAASPRLVEAAAAAARESGWGSGASPLITGRGRWHAKLETALADFEGCEATLLFPSGFSANVGTITSLVDKSDVIFSDAANHASIIDGCRLSGARIQIYRHVDIDDLCSRIDQCQGSFRRGLIVTDSLFSMDGDIAPLARLAEIAERHGLMLMVDEAHATGVFGEQGRGLCEELGVEDGVSVRIGTLSKALGSIGGFVAGSQLLVDWLSNKARGYVYSTATPEAAAAAALEAIQIVRNEPHRRTSLLARAAWLRDQLGASGRNTGRSAGQIIPVYIGDAAAVMRLSDGLRSQALLVPGIRPPTVPSGSALLRISVTWEHSLEMLERLVLALG